MEAEHTTYNDVTFGDILAKLWKSRGLFLIVPALFVLLALAGVTMWSLKLRAPIVYYVSLKGIQDDSYPNGARFSPHDLLIPQVIDSVAKQFSIEDRHALRQALQVRYGSVLEGSVNEKFRRLLASKALTTAEIDAINERYATELTKVVKSGLRIDFDNVSAGVDSSVGKAIAAAIPETWTNIYPQLFKVTLDTKLHDVSVARNAIEFRDSAGLLAANHAIRNLRRGLEIMSADDRLNSIKTAEGSDSESLLQDLNAFSTQFFDPIFHSSKNDDPISASYKRQGEFEVASLQRQVAGLNETISDLQNFRVVKQNLQPAPADTQIASSGGVQLNDSGINEIAVLVERATLADYLKEILNKRQEKLAAIADLQKEIEILNSPLDADIDASFKQSASQQFNLIATQYSELLSLSRQKLAESIGRMYVAVSSPAVEGATFPKRSMLALIFAGILGLIVATVAALVRSETAKANRRTSPSIVAVLPDKLTAS
ncbi:hypothetical protein [Mesorhizobium sp. SP-1A]|uniref:hypothetical protein n=1 Tax=Mesorhizobium sp. SP-1A TaxID=3077840 RepID=UPI0028F6FDBD|nr:hypothetical protein [Mesorhizobium sp. SP-1A]